jgi:hypothetical protein
MKLWPDDKLPPGRCPECQFHIETQGHDSLCIANQCPHGSSSVTCPECFREFCEAESLLDAEDPSQPDPTDKDERS